MPASNSWITRMLHDLQSSPEAFSELYEEMKKPLYVVAYRMVLNREDAEDVVQEVFVSLLRASNISGVKNGRAYLFQAVRNEALKRMRDGAKEIAAGDFEKLSKYRSPVKGGPSARGGSDLDLAVAALTAEERQIVALRVNAELGYTEIARITGLSTATVFRKYRAAIRNLQEYFGRGQDGEQRGGKEHSDESKNS